MGALVTGVGLYTDKKEAPLGSAELGLSTVIESPRSENTGGANRSGGGPSFLGKERSASTASGENRRWGSAVARSFFEVGPRKFLGGGTGFTSLLDKWPIDAANSVVVF